MLYVYNFVLVVLAVAAVLSMIHKKVVEPAHKRAIKNAKDHLELLEAIKNLKK